MEQVTKQNVQKQFEQFIQTATNEDRSILSKILDNLQQKKDSTGSYLSAIIKMEKSSLQDKELEITLPVHPIVYNSLDMVHGGITATLADSAMGTLVHQLLPDHQTAVTSNLSVQYIRPGTGDYLRCRASVTHQGRQLCVTEAKIVDNRNKLVATAQGTFMVIPKAK
ncbi:PaaI family thioesterase [Alkalicoccobacillus plakortidis]|uniref:Medium/long-chain acyl-CoA thioesterase YigI n=1 Tax=Alkalicoccobacillus plakortidis TaxID=444060 RepID=A0ABT0XI25_9BACI|nr:PaaI family thioesterase [Alkalicoccobacillus plakortidis]MCM2674849.1 PaaI family thioesterase [Alkalicoccobacillus plakortidis]